jgi:hypothetical protein
VQGTNPVGASRALIPAFNFLSGTAAKEFLKMKKSLALVLGVLLVFGLVLVGCDSGGGGTAPTVTVATFGVAADGSPTNNPKTTFAIGEGIAIKFTFTDPDKDVKGFGHTVKKDGQPYNPRYEEDFRKTNDGNNTDTFSFFWVGMSYSIAGTYTWEVYAFDMKGNKSKTANATFTVQ